jgi:glycosyltransferase involved in cell wall biosynthesis
MKILWFSWKDLRHPQAGGAELINEEIARRLARDGHEVILLVSGFSGGAAVERRDGYKIIRLGSRYTVYWRAYRYYTRFLRGWADLVVDEMNTIPFFCKFYVKERKILLAYQLCREIWFYQMTFPLNIIGYLIEPVYLRLIRDQYVITESESAKQDMLRYGFAAERISVISIGILAKPISSLEEVIKFTRPTLLSLGAIRGMKRTLHQIKAFEIAKKDIPNLQLKISGSIFDVYGEKVLRRIATSKYKEDIEYLGRINDDAKNQLMQKCHFILVTSVKEGWGLIVSEANAQGTPAIVYDVDGLRDSVKNLETGYIAEENTPEGMAAAIVKGLQKPKEYERIRQKAWIWSNSFSLKRCYQEFCYAAGL